MVDDADSDRRRAVQSGVEPVRSPRRARAARPVGRRSRRSRRRASGMPAGVRATMRAVRRAAARARLRRSGRRDLEVPTLVPCRHLRAPLAQTRSPAANGRPPSAWAMIAARPCRRRPRPRAGGDDARVDGRHEVEHEAGRHGARRQMIPTPATASEVTRPRPSSAGRGRATARPALSLRASARARVSTGRSRRRRPRQPSPATPAPARCRTAGWPVAFGSSRTGSSRTARRDHYHLPADRAAQQGSMRYVGRPRRLGSRTTVTGRHRRERDPAGDRATGTGGGAPCPCADPSASGARAGVVTRARRPRPPRPPRRRCRHGPRVGGRPNRGRRSASSAR